MSSEKLAEELINLINKGDISANELEAIKQIVSLLKYQILSNDIFPTLGFVLLLICLSFIASVIFKNT
ncbi:hypothetical protein KDD93_07535 [Campylobacter sp. faydin G-24]|uniref:Uncharacterized protein n=1 Tax=Campylobacter anatolicus TaxID=2829105 RepID=A0ABS5HJG8_9BACT|nr:hypothetical protein [Campylobacter anatolicus]MBR8464414.1 hypothetical protein [Campylobacter anatolicus]